MPNLRFRTSAAALLVALAVSALAGCTAAGHRDESGLSIAGAPPSKSGGDRARELEEVVFPVHLPRPEIGKEQFIIDAVARLWAEDIGTYARAGNDLVGIGPGAVPYLGYFGEVKKEVAPGQHVNITGLVLEPILAKVQPEELDEFLKSPYPAVRLASARVAGKSERKQHVDSLLVLLNDNRESVRRASVASLRRLTRHFVGYRPSGSDRERNDAANRWRVWWAGHPADAASDA
ncbi:MAG: HEAT repeat domain-containing protein [Planctomycetota bacterium]